MDRNEFIKYSLDLGKAPDAISEKLAFNGYDPLSPTELRQIERGQYGKNLVQRGLANIHDLGAGMATALGAGARYLTNSDYNKQANQQMYDLLVNPDKIGEILTENWNYDPATFAVDPKKGFAKIGAGLSTDPGYAALDLAPVIGQGVKGVKQLPKLIKSSGNVSNTAKTLTGEVITTDKAINDILNISREAPATKITELRNTYADIKNKYTPEEIAKAYQNLEEGSRVGGEVILNATEDLNKFARNVDAIMKEVGVNPNKAAEVATYQNMSRMLKADAGLDINIDDLQKVAEGNKKSIDKLVNMGIDNSIYKDYFDRAKDLYDQGLIFPVRHASNDVYQRGKSLLTLEDLKKGALAERRYGTQSYEELGKAFNEGGYEPLLKELERAKQTTGAFDEIVSEVGVKVNPDSLPTLAKGEVFVSPQVMQQVIGATLETGGKMKDAIRNTLKAFNESPEGLPKDNIYIVRKKDLNALENAFASDKRIDGWMQDLGTIGKQSALSTLNYIAGNALANATSNFATGTNLVHYVKGMTNLEDLPSALKRSSSYQGYLGKELDVNSKVKEVYKNLAKEITSDKTSPLAKAKLAQTMANYPIFRIASQFEIRDRAASYFKNADKLAKELKKDITEVLEEAKVNGGNNKTFREIKRRVDNDLGDYIGHNYYFDPRFEEAVRAFVPFYRPYTQGARVLWNITQNYPAYYQSQVKLPSLLGGRISAQGKEQGVTPDEEYRGVPINPRFGNVPSRVMYNPYHNVTAVGEIAGGAYLGNPELMPSVNTFAITPFLALMGLNRYGTEARLPNSYTVNGKQIVVDNNGNMINSNPTVADRIRLALAQTAQVYAPGVNTMNKSVLPLLATMLGKDYRSPSDYSIFGQIGDTSIPLLSEGGKTARVTKSEKMLPAFGFTIKTTYKKRKDVVPLRDRKKARQQMYINKLRNRRTK